VAHSAGACFFGYLSHEILSRSEVHCRILVSVFDDRSSLAESRKCGQEVCLVTVTGEFTIEGLDVLTSVVEPISIGREPTEEVRRRWEDRKLPTDHSGREAPYSSRAIW